MRQIASILIATVVFLATFLLTCILARYTADIQVGGYTLTGTIPGLVLAATFAVLVARSSRS